MNKLFEWTAIATSFFAVLSAAQVALQISLDWHPDWEPSLFVACLYLSGICGGVCIASAILGCFKKKQEKPN
jgi:hypothetical protein